MPRNTRENLSIPGNVFDRQHARRVPGELHNDSRNLATSSGIQRKEGIEKNGSEEPLHLTMLFSKSEENKSRRQISLMSMTNHALGILDLYSKHDNSELSHLADACISNSLTKRNFKAGS